MKKGIIFSLLFSLLSVGLHFYLSQRSYKIQAGQSEASQICNINETLNCDSVLTSPYSAIFDIPLSNFGLAFNLFLALILIGLLLKLVTDESYWKNFAFSLSGFIALTSVVMFVLSLKIKSFCPICITLYGFSFLSLTFLFFSLRKSLSKKFFLQTFKNKSSYIFSGIIIATAGFMHMSFVTQLDLKSIKQKNKLAYIDWLQAPSENFTHPGIISSGPKKSSIRIAEFIDFLCPHCKKVNKPLKDFLKSHPDVQLQLYLYPLDKMCNSSMQHNRGGRSCELSKILICGKLQNKGWETHSVLFEQQKEFSNQPLPKILKTIKQKTNVDLDLLQSCMRRSSTTKELEKQVSVGTELEISGTPSIFVNERQVYVGNIQTTLELLYRKIKNP